MSNFTIFLDKGKGNSTETSVANPTNVNINRTRGKIFQSSIRSGPRRALGDVNAGNNDNVIKVKPHDLALIKEAALKEINLNIKQQKETSEEPCEAKNKQKTTSHTFESTAISEDYCNDEIESMLPYDEQKEDDFEDIWPRKERPSEYIDKFRFWRPTSIFPNSPVCSEEPEGYITDVDSDEDSFHRGEYSFNCSLPMDEPVENIELSNNGLDDSEIIYSGNLFSQLVP